MDDAAAEALETIVLSLTIQGVNTYKTNKKNMNENFTHIENITQSPLYSEDLAPIANNKRTWGVWNYAALWISMSLCIPTYTCWQAR